MRGAHPTGTPASIDRWARKQARPAAGVEGWYELRYQGMGEPTVIARWPAAASESREWARGVLDEADEDAATRGQLTEYQLVWMHDQRDVSSRRILRGAATVAGMGTVTSPEDMVSATMKMVEQMHRLMLESTSAVMAKQEAMTNALFSRVRELEAERKEALDLHVDAMRMIAAAEAVEETEAAESRGPNQAIIQLAKLALVAVGSKDPDQAKALETGLKLVEGATE